ncbi:MAG: hypothetical protein ABI389_06540, partial [Rhodanobacter sp.]
QSPQPPNPGVSRLPPTSAPHAADEGVFEPRVRGPNDSPTPLAAVAKDSAKPAADGADLRMEQRDGALVF